MKDYECGDIYFTDVYIYMPATQYFKQRNLPKIESLIAPNKFLMSIGVSIPRFKVFHFIS